MSLVAGVEQHGVRQSAPVLALLAVPAARKGSGIITTAEIGSVAAATIMTVYVVPDMTVLRNAATILAGNPDSVKTSLVLT